MTKPVTVTLRKGIESALQRGHPWVWADALAPWQAAPGDVATVRDGRGRFVARGIVDEAPIGVRVFTTRDEAVDAGLGVGDAREGEGGGQEIPAAPRVTAPPPGRDLPGP